MASKFTEPVNLFIFITFLALSLSLFPSGDCYWPTDQHHHHSLARGRHRCGHYQQPHAHHNSRQHYRSHHRRGPQHSTYKSSNRASSSYNNSKLQDDVTSARYEDSSLAGSTSRGFKYKRQAALDLAVNRLHILESLDGQLREFAATAVMVTEQQQQDSSIKSENPSKENQTLLCILKLDFGKTEELSGCLADPRLKSHIPPYMLNLHRQLLSESRTLAEAVRLMPYQSLVMRSFTQPALSMDIGKESIRADEHDHKGLRERTNVVVELSALRDAEGEERDGENEDLDLKAGGATAAGGEYNATKDSKLLLSSTDAKDMLVPESPACNLNQRSLLAHRRSELCYWFQMSEQLRKKINGSLVRTHESSSWKRERLIEAEFHVFKLLPELSLANGDNSNAPLKGRGGLMVRGPTTRRLKSSRRQTREAYSNHSRGANNLYHLKTNLLEVSLYQILPKKTSSNRNYSDGQMTLDAGLDKEFPLRLLDIRRIDLDSSGWEIFYVKRAVEDWIYDPSLNLGLVIKAKSMFEEPIKIGLIRFADLYDHQKDRLNSEQSKEVDLLERQTESERKTNIEFDSSHQPILVIYTTTTTK